MNVLTAFRELATHREFKSQLQSHSFQYSWTVTSLHLSSSGWPCCKRRKSLRKHYYALRPGGEPSIRALWNRCHSHQGQWRYRNCSRGVTKAVGVSEKVQDLTLRCGDAYNKQLLRGFFPKCDELSISSKKCWCRTDKSDATIEDLAHQAQERLDLQGSYWKAAVKEGQWIKVVRRNIKEGNRKRNPNK